ncbi:MAG: HEAT repeat domain-containing protein [Planctomycetota bacterium]
MKKVLIIAITAIFVVMGCVRHTAHPKIEYIQPVERSGYFIADNQPVESLVKGNPLQYTAKRIGLDLDNYELPRAHEGFYRLACRFPIIDYVSNRPLYMKQWAEDTTGLINKYHRENGLEAVNYAIGVLRGAAGFPTVNASYEEKIYDETAKSLSLMNFTPKYQEAFLKLYKTYLVACKINKEAKKNLTEKDKRFFYQNPAYFLAPDGRKMPSLTGNVDTQFRFIEHARLIAYENIFYAAKILADAVQEYVTATKSFKKDDFYVDINNTDETSNFDTPYGSVVISGFGNDIHKEDASLLIDLGGNDTYTNNAGGAYYTPSNIAVCIDHSGADIYSVTNKNYVQGFGFLGVGYLVDMAGDDKYYSGNFSQGAGIMGVGAIWDLSGNDVYDGNAFCQGAGMFGLGMLMDSAGNDSYDASTNAQGSATTLGLGILSDLEGDDRYQIALNPAKDNLGAELAGFGQGGALSFRSWPFIKKLTAYGGVGILTDAEGDDNYKAGGVYTQGGSYIMSLGVSMDYNGNDHYTGTTGLGSCVHISNAICIDKNGNDTYETGWGSGGVSGDRSNAMFIDYSGDDVYYNTNGAASFGTARKPFAFALFLDYLGQDKYLYKPIDKGYQFGCFGEVLPDTTASSWPFAISLDLNGNDNYQVENRRNNSERFSFGHGIHLDTEWAGGDIIGAIQNPLELYGDFALPRSVKNTPYYSDIKLLQNPDVFIRFQAIGRIINYGVNVIPCLVDSIKDSTHRQFNRDIMECIHYYLTQNRVTGKESLYLVPLLKAQDEEVRILMAHNLGLWEFRNCEYALIETMKKDKSGQVRRFALAGLLNLQSTKVIPLLRKLAITDPSDDVRRLSVTYLGMIDKTNSLDVILRVLDNDPIPAVQIAATESFGNFYDERALAPLRKAAQSDDVYLRRAAAKGLAALYQVDAIGILIDSLSFPSLDTTENYGVNLINLIAAYAGFDFPKDKRYDQAQWKEWYQANKDKIDIRKNVDSLRDLSELTASVANAPAETRIQRYEEFLAKYTDNKPVKEVLGNLLNQVAWDMVTSGKTSPVYNPAKGLQYARRAVELIPAPAIIDTLIEAYYANGNIDKAIEICREELAKTPDEKMFKDRLEKYLKEKGENKPR